MESKNLLNAPRKYIITAASAFSSSRTFWKAIDHREEKQRRLKVRSELLVFMNFENFVLGVKQSEAKL